MSTKVYGASDDLVEVEGDVTGAVDFYGNDDDNGVLLSFSDGTLLTVKYGQKWEVRLIHGGELFEKIEQCPDEDEDNYSDIAYFKDGLKWAYAGKEWEKVG